MFVTDKCERKLFEKCGLKNSIGGRKSDKKTQPFDPDCKLTCLSSAAAQQFSTRYILNSSK